MKKDLLSIDDLTSDEIYLILDTSEAMREIGQRPIKKVPTLRGKTIVNLFYEASTRTRTSFEIAEKRLSADTLNIAVASSSVLKGETLVDTALNIEAMQPDMIVLRHASSGAGHLLSRICRSRIINAGDGMHEHPTQALLDAFTIREHKKRIAGLKARAAELGRSPADIEVAPQFSVTVGTTLEAAEKRYMESGLVAHRLSLAYTGRDLSHQVVANLVGSPDVILQKIDKLGAIGVDHCSALMFPADSVTEMNEQIEWFATDVMARFGRPHALI